jgi:hypothetical protein
MWSCCRLVTSPNKALLAIVIRQAILDVHAMLFFDMFVEHVATACQLLAQALSWFDLFAHS